MSYDRRCVKCLRDHQRTAFAHTKQDAATGNPAQHSHETTYPPSAV
jgi:hypothetical protein